MCRVAVIGNAGGGKTTLCKELSKAKGLPLHTVDKYQWKPNWAPASKAELKNSLKSLSEGEFWIIDGWGGWESIEERFAAADTIIFVDHPVRVHLWWAAKRQIKALLRPSSVDQPAGCDLTKVTAIMFKMIWVIHKTMRPRLKASIESFSDQKMIYHIKSPGELRSFMLSHCQKA